jgi:hypothetical protein
MRSITSIFIIPRLQTNNYIGKAMTQRFVREQELLTLPEHMSSPPLFSGVRVTRSFMCMFCRSLSVLLYFFFWPLCCLFFFDIRILITPLVTSYSSIDIVILWYNLLISWLYFVIFYSQIEKRIFSKYIKTCIEACAKDRRSSKKNNLLDLL